MQKITLTNINKEKCVILANEMLEHPIGKIELLVFSLCSHNIIIDQNVGVIEKLYLELGYIA